jgi:hypothetical protein
MKKISLNLTKFCIGKRCAELGNHPLIGLFMFLAGITSSAKREHIVGNSPRTIGRRYGYPMIGMNMICLFANSASIMPEGKTLLPLFNRKSVRQVLLTRFAPRMIYFVSFRMILAIASIVLWFCRFVFIQISTGMRSTLFSVLSVILLVLRFYPIRMGARIFKHPLFIAHLAQAIVTILCRFAVHKFAEWLVNFAHATSTARNEWKWQLKWGYFWGTLNHSNQVPLVAQSPGCYKRRRGFARSFTLHSTTSSAT